MSGGGFDKGEYDALYTLLEEVLPVLWSAESQRTALFLMDRCEAIVGPLRRQGERLNNNEASGIFPSEQF
jgi:hypothetical protein